MGRIITSVTVTNALQRDRQIRCDALVDTGTSILVLPSAWRDRLGEFLSVRAMKMELADQTVVTGEVCGPVQIQIEGFDAIFNEVTFLNMAPSDGGFEPLLGYIILEQSQASVDMVGHRLVRVRHMDLKKLFSSWRSA